MISQLAITSTFYGTRGSGLPTEPLSAGEEASGRRTPERQAEAVNGGGRANGVAPLAPEAVLALQNADTEQRASRRRDEARATSSQSGSSSGQTIDTRSDADGAQDGADSSPGEVSADQAAKAEAKPAGPATSASAASSPADASQQSEDDADGDGLTEAEEKQVEKLKQRDREVRAHEQAHARAGGAYAGAPSYTFQQGPDGGRYAIGGEVAIDTSPERTAEATIRKMQVVIRAATAPAEPSSQDLKVAQQARAQLAEAQAQARAERAAEQGGGEEDEGGLASPNSSDDAAAAATPPGGSAQGGERGDERPGSRRSAGEAQAASAVYESVSRFSQAFAVGKDRSTSFGIVA